MKAFWIIISVLIIFFTGCEREKIIDPDFMFKSDLVCTGFLQRNGQALVYIQSTKNPFNDTENQDIESSVQLIKDDDFVKDLVKTENDLFVSDTIVVNSAEDVFKIEVKTDEFGVTYSDWVNVPEKVIIDSAAIRLIDQRNLNVTLYFNDPEQINYYAITLKACGLEGNCVNCESNYIHFNPFSAFDDTMITDGAIRRSYQVVNTDDEGNLLISNLEIILYHLDENMYKYYSSLQEEEGSFADMWVEPTVVFSNIKNGYGVFGAFASDTIHQSIISN